MKRKNYCSSAEKTLLILQLLAKKASPMSIKAIASELSIERNAVYRSVNSLVHTGGHLQKPLELLVEF